MCRRTSTTLPLVEKSSGQMYRVVNHVQPILVRYHSSYNNPEPTSVSLCTHHSNSSYFIKKDKKEHSFVEDKNTKSTPVALWLCFGLKASRLICVKIVDFSSNFAEGIPGLQNNNQ